MYYLCSENKDADQFAVTAKLICVFVFAYAKCWFSHDTAHFICIANSCVSEQAGLNMSFVMRKPSLKFPAKSITNLAVQPQKMPRGLKLRI